MATGPWHYTEAERLLEPGMLDDLEPELVAQDIARAQVHATLALAAATALGHWTADGTLPQPDRMDWWRAASGEPAERERIKAARVAEAAEAADLAEGSTGQHGPGHNCGYCPDVDEVAS